MRGILKIKITDWLRLISKMPWQVFQQHKLKHITVSMKLNMKQKP